MRQISTDYSAELQEGINALELSLSRVRRGYLWNALLYSVLGSVILRIVLRIVVVITTDPNWGRPVLMLPVSVVLSISLWFWQLHRFKREYHVSLAVINKAHEQLGAKPGTF